MFQMLDEKEKDILVDAMQIVTFNSGDTVIKEGDDGDNLFVVEEGKLACTKVLVGHVLRIRKREIHPPTLRITSQAKHSVSLLCSTTPLVLPPLWPLLIALSSPWIVRPSTTL